MVTVFNDVQYSNIFALIRSTLYGIFIDISEEHLENACDPIDVTLSGILIDSREEHPENAISPIDVMLSGMFIDLSEEHY